MHASALLRAAFVLLLAALVGAQAPPTGAQLPLGFVDQVVVAGLERAVGLAFEPQSGDLFAWEKAGRVWRFGADGELPLAPALDVSEEVGDWGDHGLLGFALDPGYATNGLVYLLYVVDHHHLQYFGTPEYDPEASEPYRDTIGRITRYQLVGQPPVADPGSRTVLLGVDAEDAFPICSASHGVGSLVFGEDGSLLASCGEGNGPPASITCLAEGILQPKEDVGSFRAQLVDSLGGKVVRLDPATGDGLPSNPFFDPVEPRAARSRVWALGVRNPFRFTLRPGTGDPDPSLGDPGTLYLGDVGGTRSEEIDVIEAAGTNLGWPIYEGLDWHPSFSLDLTDNLDAPNPLFGTCPQEFFHFQDLLVQDTLNPPFWANPCAPLDPITGVPVFEHKRPAIDAGHDEVARTGTYDAFGEATAALLGAPDSPVSGLQFGGVCAVAGSFCPPGSFPAPWQGLYFHGDYALGWIKAFAFDGAGQPTAVVPFAAAAGGVVALAFHPLDGDLYYLDYSDFGIADVRRIRYVEGNLPPEASATAEPLFGPTPLEVSFEAGDSGDPEGGELSYGWDFGDGTYGSILAAPVRSFPSEDITATGTIIAKVFELDPPQPTGNGSLDPEVLRDGDIPPLNTSEPLRQFDTAHYQPGFHPDKGLTDWVGYVFPAPREFTGLLFQEGMIFAGYGGWMTDLHVQVRQDGVWNEVPGWAMDPPYPGLFVPHFEIFETTFPPVVGDGLRVFCNPGGELDFFSLGELRAIARPLSPTGLPTGLSVTLTVTDDGGASDEAELDLALDDTPPTAVILTPENGSPYETAMPQLVELTAAVSDAEHLASELVCTWQTILHHDVHTHPDAPVEGCPASATLVPDCCDGTLHFQEVRLTVSDPLGLSRTVSHYLVPDDDRNLNGFADSADIVAGVSLDLDGNGIPDEAEADCDRNGTADLFELFFGLAADRNGNGKIDACEPLHWKKQKQGPAPPVSPAF